MNDVEAKNLAHRFLCENIDLECCNEQPQGFYGFHPSEEILFRFRLFGALTSIGSSEYVAVSKITGKVRYLGHLGE